MIASSAALGYKPRAGAIYRLLNFGVVLKVDKIFHIVTYWKVEKNTPWYFKNKYKFGSLNIVNTPYLPLRLYSYILLYLLCDVYLPYLLYCIIIYLSSNCPLCLRVIIAAFYIVAKGWKQNSSVSMTHAVMEFCGAVQKEEELCEHWPGAVSRTNE